MKPKLSIGVCVLISLALVLFGLLFGTASGFADDRQRVNALLSGEGGVLEMLSYRGADGLNLSVITRRHINGDPESTAIEALSKRLRSAKAPLSEKMKENARLTELLPIVVATLGNTPTFQDSPRDRAYLDMLVTDLDQLARNPVITTYNEAAQDFNAQLDQPVSGTLARLLGVKPCELYQ